MKVFFTILILVFVSLVFFTLSPQTSSIVFVIKKYYLFGVNRPLNYNGEWREWDKEFSLTKIANYKDGVLEGKSEIFIGDSLHCTLNFKNGLAEGIQEDLSEKNKIVTWMFKQGFPDAIIYEKFIGASEPQIISHNIQRDQLLPSQIISNFNIGFNAVGIDLNKWLVLTINRKDNSKY